MMTPILSFLLGAAATKYGPRMMRKWLPGRSQFAGDSRGPRPPARSAGGSVTATALRGMQEIGELVTTKMRVRNVGQDPSSQSWFVYESQSLLVICDFEVEYRVDLRRLKMRHADGRVQILVPRGQITTSVREVEVFHMQGSRLLGFPINGLDKKDLNRLLREARDEAMRPYCDDASEVVAEGEASLRRTLSAVCLGLGVDVERLEFCFPGSQAAAELGRTPTAGRLGSDQLPRDSRLLA